MNERTRPVKDWENATRCYGRREKGRKNVRDGGGLRKEVGSREALASVKGLWERYNILIELTLLIYYTGCSLNIVFFQKILKYSGLWPFSVLPRCQCVYTRQAGRKPALQQSW